MYMFRTLSVPEVLRSVEYRRLGTMIRRRRPVTGARPLFTCLMCACVAAIFIPGLFVGMGLTVGFCVGLSVTACEVTLGVFLSIVVLLSIPYFVAVVFCLCKGKSRRIGIASQQYDVETAGSNNCGVSKNPSQSDKDGLPSDNVVTDVQLLQPQESEQPELPVSELTELPVSELTELPVSELTELAISELTELPVSEFPELPVSGLPVSF